MDSFEMNNMQDNMDKICDICGKEFTTKRYVKLHKMTHLPREARNSIQCPKCNHRYLYKHHLLRHLRNRHQTDVLEGDVCREGLKTDLPPGSSITESVMAVKQERNNAWSCQGTSVNNNASLVSAASCPIPIQPRISSYGSLETVQVITTVPSPPSPPSPPQLHFTSSNFSTVTQQQQHITASRPLLQLPYNEVNQVQSHSQHTQLVPRHHPRKRLPLKRLLPSLARLPASTMTSNVTSSLNQVSPTVSPLNRFTPLNSQISTSPISSSPSLPTPTSSSSSLPTSSTTPPPSKKVKMEEIELQITVVENGENGETTKENAEETNSNDLTSNTEEAIYDRPQLSYSLSQPVPSPYKHVIPAGVSSVKPRDLSDLKNSIQGKLDAIFDDLAARYSQLDTEKQVFEKAVEAFQDEKRTHFEQYEKQQKELDEMRNQHKKQTEDWLNEKKKELEKEWKELREDKETFTREREALVASSKHAEAFKRIDAILSEVKGST